ncbi:MAG: hypothetical protein DMF68_21570, partial [Acidobacteria bacterium]
MDSNRTQFIVRLFKCIVLAAFAIAIACLILTSGCTRQENKEIVDEAKAAGKTAADFPETDVDVFKGMDSGITLTSDEVKG